MKTVSFFISLCLLGLLGSPAQGAVRTSGAYTQITEVVDSGGGAPSSTGYTQTSTSIGLTLGVQSSATYSQQAGFLPQATVTSPPALASVSPTSGTTAGGTSVTITGTDFTGATAVTFGGTAATSFTVDSATQITATTPAGSAGPASVLVTTPGGTNAANMLFTYNSTPTDITLSASSIAENNAANATVGTLAAVDADSGQTHTFSFVTGTGDTNNADFSIEGTSLKITPVADFEVKSSYSVRIRSTDQGGLFFEKPFTITISNVNEAPTNIALAGGFVYENATAGTAVGMFSSTDADVGNTHTYTLVSGAGDTNNANFSIGGGMLVALAGIDFEVGATRSIRVRSTDQGGQFSEKEFTVIIGNKNEMPSFVKGADQLLPYNTSSAQSVSGWATAIDDGDSTVTQALTFNISSHTNPGLFTTAPSIDSSTGTLTYTPNGTAGTATIGVTITDDATINGHAALTSSVQTFTITTAPPPPTVTVITPTSGSTAGGTSVTITGTNFSGASSVTIGGTAATSVNVVNATTITATTPAHAAGAVSVLVTTPGGTNAANTLFTYVTPPTVASVSPATGSVLGGTSVTITGTNFSGASSVTIGGTAATSVDVVNATTITATTPAHAAGTVSVLVTTPGGSNAANTLFTYANPGDLDTTFSVDGFQSTFVEAGGSLARDVVRQSDGKIVVAGSSAATPSGDTNTLLARFLPDGTLDTTFGSGGKVVLDLSGINQPDWAHDLLLMADGRLLIGGVAYDGSNYNFLVARFSANGTPDTSFDTDGKVITPVGTTLDWVYEVAVQADGKIVAAGTAATSGNEDIGVVRYNSNGSLDTTFGTGGKVITPIGTGHDNGNAGMVLLPDGRIVVGGQYQNGAVWDFCAVRYLPTGALDTTFDGDGKVVTSAGASLQNADLLALQPDGRLLVGGTTSNGSAKTFSMVRVLTNGALDSSFGTSGRALHVMGSLSDDFRACVLQPDGRILVGGYAHNGTYQDSQVWRLNIDGSLDSVFGTGGKAVNSISPAHDMIYGLALAPDGTIIGAGRSDNESAVAQVMLLRLLGFPRPAISSIAAAQGTSGANLGVSGQIDPAGLSTTVSIEYGTTAGLGSTQSVGTFTGSGAQSLNATLYPGGLTFGTTYYYRVVATNANGATTSTTQTLVFAPGAPDFTFSGDGAQITPVFVSGNPVGAFGRGIVRQADGKILVSGHGGVTNNTEVLLARYLDDGTLDSSFGTSGIITTPVRAGDDTGTDMLLLPDGKIVISGTSSSAPTGGTRDVIVVRYLSNGTLDATFGVGGIARGSFSTLDDYGEELVLQPDGKLLVCGSSINTTTGNLDTLVLRLNTDGFVDTTFNGTGYRVIQLSSTLNDVAADILLLPDGKIILAGYIGSSSPAFDSYIMRLNSNGSTDTSFGVSGIRQVDAGGADAILSVARQADGRLVACGYATPGATGQDSLLLRLTSDGALDTSFNSTGKLILNYGNSDDYLSSIAIQPDGRLVAVGRSYNGSNMDWLAVRVNPDGTPDTTFDGDGRWTQAGGSGTDELSGVMIAPDGRILATGRSDTAGGVSQIAVVRLLGGPNDLLVNGSFESQEFVGPNGAGPWPVGYGDWGGDQAAIVTAENGITPYAGSRMLKFVATGAGGAGAGGGSETTQLVDLTPWASQIAAGQLTVAVTMRVNRVAGNASSDTRFVVALGARSGSASSFTMLTAVDNPFLSDNNPSTWELVSGSLLIPPGTTHLEVNLQAVENVVNDSTAPEFDGHYMDDAQLTLTIAPDIQVEQPVGTILVDGSSTVDFGTTPLGTPVTRTFRVTNTGGQTLNVTGITLPSGYEHVGTFTAYTLAPNASQNFDVRFLANTVPGTFTGTMTLTSNDPDAEGSFAVELTGRAALVYPGAKAIKIANPSAPDGVYTLDPDGPGGADPFDAYCDMTTNGGGWTLLLKANGSQATFQYSSALWTNTTTLNPGDPGLNTTEFKSAGFSTIPFNALMVGLGTGRLQLSLPGLSQTSLRAMFSGGTLVASNSRTDWLALTPNPGNFDLMGGAQLGGVNVTASGADHPNVRVGMLMNNEADMVTPDAYVGVGASSWGGNLTTTAGASNYLAPVVHYPTTGYLFVRDTTAGAALNYAAEITNFVPTSITSTTATLYNLVNPKGITTNAWFEWGLTTSYGNTTSSQAIGYGTSVVPVSTTLTGLTPGTTYYARLVAQNGVTTEYGSYSTIITLTPYQAWAAANSVTGTNTGPNDDFDSDGVVNQLEWAFGMNPTVSGTGVIVVTGGVITQHGSPTVSIDRSSGFAYKALFGRRKDWVAAGLTFTVQFSGDLTNWFNSAATPTVIADDGEVEAVTVPYPLFVGGKKAQFYQVVVGTGP